MKIKLLRGMVINRQACSKGSEVEVADRDGRQLISSGRAVEVKPIQAEAPKKRGRPPKQTKED